MRGGSACDWRLRLCRSAPPYDKAGVSFTRGEQGYMHTSVHAWGKISIKHPAGYDRSGKVIAR
jgi:hypothetical protein